jgi:hypothetical protein
MFAVASPALGRSIGPSGYFSAADSPFAGGAYSYFHLENFEDGLLNTPGVIGVGGTVIGPPRLNVDSVDGDDGTVDGSGSLGRSYFNTLGATGVGFTFDAAVLGTLPTDVGLVWTDGQPSTTVTFEAFDALGVSLGTLVATGVGDANNIGGTAEDRFFGWRNGGGISRIHMKSVGPSLIGGIEVDHLQYGVAVAVVPLPAAVWPGLAMLGGIWTYLTLRRGRSK